MTYLADKLAPLDSYLATNAFGKLNTQITSTLLSAAEYMVADGEGEISKGTLAIPNNRKFGTYEYVVINRAVAEEQLAFSGQTELLNITSSDDILTFISEAQARLTQLNIAGNISTLEDTNGNLHVYMPDGTTELLYTVTGPYELKENIEASNDWLICNVAEYPIATVEEAYASAFGVIPTPNLTENVTVKVDGQDVIQTKTVIDYVERAMEIIYAINTDVTVRNTLQYGVENTNFLLHDGFVTPITNAGSNYNMKLEYTGDVLKAYYLDGVWTPDMAANTKSHNGESVLPD